MSHKIVVLLGVAFLAIQIQGLQPYEDGPAPRNDVEDMLKKLEKTVDDALVKAQKALDDAKAKVNGAAASIQAAAVAQMQDTEHKLQEEIDKLKEKAAKAGVNIDECLAGNEEQLVNLPNNLSNDMVHCVSDKINEGIHYAQDALDKIKAIVAEVENVRQEIKDCGHGFKAVKCLAKLAIKIEGDITSLPTQIEADAAATVVLINTLQDKVQKCASDKVDKCESDGKTILEKISLCVAKKIVI